MSEVNIFGNIDATGILSAYKDKIDNYYGGDPTVESPSSGVKAKIIDPSFAPLKIGYHDSRALPSYTRLISSKGSTVGYEIRPGDTVTRDGKTYLTNTYNLTITAKNGDTIRWWGHTIVPNLQTQGIISNISRPGASQSPPPQFTDMTAANVSFYNTAGAIDTSNLMKGLQISTRAAFCINCVLQGSIGQNIAYDIDIMIMSAPMVQAGSLVTFPIVRVVVDPTVIITG